MERYFVFAFICLNLLFVNNLAAQDWPNLARFQEANAQLEAPKKGVQRVVFMGNSITQAWGNMVPEFFANKPYINRGISGQTTPQMLIRFRPDVIDLDPAVVVILAGTNDIAGNTGPSTIKMIADNLKSMAEIAQANGIRVVMASVLPVYDYPWRPGLEPAMKIVELNQIMKKYCKQNKIVYLDFFKKMADDRNGMQEAYASDGVHPTKEGYAVMAPLTEAAIAKALKK
jgi:lysophospholipase L1-like esterase